MGRKEKVKTSSLIQVLGAAHLTYYLDGVPENFQNRGGVMLVAPPENFKTVMASCLRHYPNAMLLGDITTMQMAKIRDDIALGKIRTLVFPEFEKLYKREDSTAANVEGHIQQLIEEGFAHAAFEDKTAFVRTAKCMVVGALVENKYRVLWPEWSASGFARRWLWCHFLLDDRNVILRSICDWTPLKLSDKEGLPVIPIDPIPWAVTKPEAQKLLRFLGGPAEAKASPFILLQKILSVLKWRYRHLGPKKANDRAWEVMTDFSECLDVAGGGARLELPAQV
jgi:hypothetical protein